MVLAVRASQLGKAKQIVSWLIFTLFFGLIFLGVKAFEWSEKFREHHIPGLASFHLEGQPTRARAQIFFSLYFAMTGLHALHMIVGVGILTWLVSRSLPRQVLRQVQHASRYRAAFTGTSSILSGSSSSRCCT